MKINPITMISNNVYKVNFKAANNNDDEYVYVPLIWDNESYDSVDFSKTQGQNQQGNTPTGAPQGNQPANPNSQNQGSRFKRFATKAAGAVGTVTLVPAGIEKVAKGVENTVTSTKDSINNTMDSVAEIKDHARTLFHKDKPQDSTIAQTTDTHTESLLAGETPVQDHRDFDQIHQNNDEHGLIDDIADDHDHDYDNTNQDDVTDAGFYEG
ncbi:MAG: hypothetical protein NC191_07100 [Muribaculaceae bacterium]|nr:hypothetical protein [Muribaculaceae bacterium]